MAVVCLSVAAFCKYLQSSAIDQILKSLTSSLLAFLNQAFK